MPATDVTLTPVLWSALAVGMVFSDSKILQVIDWSEVQREQKANSDVHLGAPGLCWGTAALAGPAAASVLVGLFRLPRGQLSQTGTVPWLGTGTHSGCRATSSSLWGPGRDPDMAEAPGLCAHLCPFGLPGSRLSQWHSSRPCLVPCPAPESSGSAATRPSVGLELGARNSLVCCGWPQGERKGTSWAGHTCTVVPWSSDLCQAPGVRWWSPGCRPNSPRADVQLGR